LFLLFVLLRNANNSQRADFVNNYLKINKKMENQNSNQNCDCGDGCCTPSTKSNLWKRLLFCVIILAAGAIITAKMVGKNDETVAKCCPTEAAKCCPTEAAKCSPQAASPSCCAPQAPSCCPQPAPAK
jgi:hypothetical protein